MIIPHHPHSSGTTSPGTFGAGLGSKAGTEISPTYGEKARKNIVFFLLGRQKVPDMVTFNRNEWVYKAKMMVDVR